MKIATKVYNNVHGFKKVSIIENIVYYSLDQFVYDTLDMLIKELFPVSLQQPESVKQAQRTHT